MTHIDIDTFGATPVGWFTYILCVPLIVAATCVLGWKSFHLYRGLIGGGWGHGYRGTLLAVLCLNVSGSLVLFLLFVHLVALEPVHSITTAPDYLVLKYRWSERRIPWRDLLDVKLVDTSARRRQLVIVTGQGTWTVQSSAREHDAAVSAAFQAIREHVVHENK